MNALRCLLHTGVLSVGVLSALLLGGCGTLPLSPSARQVVWQAHQAELRQYDAWDLTGRIAVRANGDGGSASLRWKQVGERYEIRIFDALGRTRASLAGGPGEVVLRTPEGDEYVAADAESLLLERLGWRVPVSGLRYWILGLPVPAETSSGLELDERGHLARLYQSGWDIRYPEYDTVDEQDLPGRLVLARDQLVIKLAVDRWRLDAPFPLNGAL